MLINMRNGLMAGKRLPYDAEVEYLESTGTQWIDTGIISANSTRISVLTSCSTTSNGFIFCAFANNSYMGPQFLSGVGLRIFCGTASYNYKQSDFVANTVYRYEIDNGAHNGAYGAISIDGVVVKTTGVNGGIGGKIDIFGNSTLSSYASCKIYSVQIYEGNVLVRDFIPVRKGTVGYLYDRVTRKLFGNAGTGDFVLGPDVVPVEYIESHGTEWIDTGIKLTSSYEYDIDFNILRDKGSVQSVSSTYNTWATSNPLFLMGISTYFSGRLVTTGIANPESASQVNVGWDYGQRVAMSLRGSTITYNGADYSFTRYQGGAVQSNYNQPLFGTLRASTSELAVMRLWHCDIWADGTTLLRKFRPVRVGTDATSWEGAMMDVLTRRIYRNAGTGAFTYGNDV